MPTTDTAIGWTDDTWNPTHGCFKVSEGCRGCYAARDSQRYNHTPEPWSVNNVDENLRIQDHHLAWPTTLEEPRRIFVNSMSDLFPPKETPEGEPLLTDEYLHEIFDVIEDQDRHVFQALTKHGAETGGIHGEEPRLLEWDREYGRWPDNLWMGVSVEQENRTYRYELLEETGAATKWISFEPLVGEVETLALEGMDWAVVGGESGDDYRPMDHAWARSIKDACRAAGIPFFFKQSAAKQNETAPYLRLERDGFEVQKEYRELPELTPELAAARPELAEQVVA